MIILQLPKKKKSPRYLESLSTLPEFVHLIRSGCDGNHWRLRRETRVWSPPSSMLQVQAMWCARWALPQRNGSNPSTFTVGYVWWFIIFRSGKGKVKTSLLIPWANLKRPGYKEKSHKYRFKSPSTASKLPCHVLLHIFYWKTASPFRNSTCPVNLEVRFSLL